MSKARRGIQSVEIGSTILSAFTNVAGPLHLREVAQATGMPASKVYRYLVSLGVGGLVTQDASGRYDLGPFAIQLGLAALGRLDELDVVASALTRATEEFGRDAYISIWNVNGPIIMRWKPGPTDIAIRVREGMVLPALSTATGRVWLCHLPAAKTEALVEAEFAVLQKKTGRTLKALRRDYDERIAAVRRSGLSRSEEEMRAGIDGLAGPIFNRDGMAFVLTILSPHGEADLSYDGALAEKLRKVLKDISRRLGASMERLATPG
jgi:DNA-binding IclR family transcriptional regulator